MLGVPVVEVYYNMFTNYGEQENPIEVVRYELMEYIRRSENFHELLTLYALVNKDPIMYMGKDIEESDKFTNHIFNSDEFKNSRRDRGGSHVIRSQETSSSGKDDI